MSRNDSRLRVGDWVEVKTQEEISPTLDADGALEGLPFMPEMVEFCGKRFRVVRQARKACVECLTPKYKSIDMREFLGMPVWVIEGLRCIGAAHDGCQRGCLLFWKDAWLRKLDVGVPPLHPSKEGHASLSLKLKSKAAPDR